MPLFIATCHSVPTQHLKSEHQYRQTSVLAADNYNCLGVQILLQSPQHHPEEFNMSEPDRKIAAFITTMYRTSLFHNHLEKQSPDGICPTQISVSCRNINASCCTLQCWHVGWQTLPHLRGSFHGLKTSFFTSSGTKMQCKTSPSSDFSK